MLGELAAHQMDEYSTIGVTLMHSAAVHQQNFVDTNDVLVGYSATRTKCGKSVFLPKQLQKIT